MKIEDLTRGKLVICRHGPFQRWELETLEELDLDTQDLVVTLKEMMENSFALVVTDYEVLME